MQLIDFKILMEEFNIPVIERISNFCGVKFKQYGERENATICFKLGSLPSDIVRKFELESDYSDGTFATGNRQLVIELIIELAKYYGVQDKFKTCMPSGVLANVNQKFYDKVISYSKKPEQWLNDNGHISGYFGREKEAEEEDKVIRNLLTQFDALVNPFASNFYNMKPIADFSDRFSLGFTFTNGISYYYEGSSCFDISEYDDINWHASYADASNPKLILGERDLSGIEFNPSHRFTFYKGSEDGKERYSIKHIYYGDKELLSVTGDASNKKISYNITNGHKTNSSMVKDINELITEGEKKIIIKCMCEAVDFLHSKIVGTICSEKESMPPKERYEIIKKLIGKGCTNCINGCCTVPVEEKIGVDEDGLPQGSYCMGWENDRIVGRSKTLRKNNIYELR